MLLTVKELSSLLSLHPNTIYKLVEKGEIPFIKRKGVGIRFRKEEVEEWLNQGSLKINSFIESFSKVDLALDRYDRLFLKGGRMSQKAKTWNYPFGSVYLRLKKTGKSSWYIYYRVDGKRIREVVKNAQSRADALKVLQSKVADAFRGEYGFKRESKRVKFAEFADQYLETYAKVNKSEKSWKTDAYYLKYMKNFFGKFYLDEINALDIEKYKAERLKQGVKKSTVNRCLAIIRKMLNLAVDGKLISNDQKIKIKFFSEKDNLMERIINREEEDRLLEASSGYLKPILIVALNTGMRLGEILNLKWSQIDLRAREIRVEKTKSKKIRLIFINAILQEELMRLKQKRGAGEYLFLNPKTGKPLTTVKRAFKGACRRAGISNMRFHDLRHTFATRLVQRGVDLITVKELLGHSSVTITERYTHSYQEQKREAVELLAQRESGASNFVHTVSPQKEDRASTTLFSMN